MSQRRTAARYLNVSLATALLAWNLPGLVSAVYAQSGSQEAPYRVSDSAEIGDSWLVGVEAATVSPAPASDALSAGQVVLTTRLEVRNVSSLPRYFPTDRLRVASDSGSPARVTSCGPTTNPLELSGRIAPNGSLTGSACWLLNSADVSSARMYDDPPQGEQGRPRVFFALPPLPSVEAATAPVVAPSPLPMSTGAPPRVAASSNPNGPALDPATCTTVYNAWARASGAYLSPACPTTNGSILGTGPDLRGTGAPPCLLYPSAAQPLPTSVRAQPTPVPVSGQPAVAPLQAAAQGPTGGMSC